jgi:hypothetical protein
MYLHFVIFTIFLYKKNQWNKYSTKLRIIINSVIKTDWAWCVSLMTRDLNLSFGQVLLNHIKVNSIRCSKVLKGCSVIVKGLRSAQQVSSSSQGVHLL